MYLLIINHSGKGNEATRSKTSADNGIYGEPKAANGPLMLSTVLTQEQPVGITNPLVINRQSLLENAPQGQESSKGVFQKIISAFTWTSVKETQAVLKILNFNGTTHTSVTTNPSVFQELVILLGQQVSCGQITKYCILIIFDE